MSSNLDSASTSGHFTANMGPRDRLRSQLDGYLMMHANRSLPMARRSSVQDTLTLWHWAENFIAQPQVAHVERTKVRFVFSEMSIDECSVSLRAINTLNNQDTIHRISLPESTESPAGLILPLVRIQRIGLPKNAVEVAMADLHTAEIVFVSDQAAYNPELTLSVLRAASLLCQFIRTDLA